VDFESKLSSSKYQNRDLKVSLDPRNRIKLWAFLLEWERKID